MNAVTRVLVRVGAAIAAATISVAAQTRAAQTPRDPAITPSAELEVLQLRPDFYMIAGAGGNIGVQVGEDGALVLDTGSAPMAGAVVAAIKRITGQPIRYIVNTSADSDHVGGNEVVAKAGETLLGSFSLGLPSDFLGSGAASIVATGNVLKRMSAPSGQSAPFPFASWPTETFDWGRKYMYLNDEGIEILQQPAAHTDGDLVVFFRRSDVVVAGDILDTTRFPVIDVARGGSIQGEIDALNRLIALAIPSVPLTSREVGTIVIPGHGRVCDQFDVTHYRDMITIIRDNVRDLMKAGKTLEEIQAAAPAKGYTRRYGSDAGPWTTNDFIEAIYRSLDRTPR